MWVLCLVLCVLFGGYVCFILGFDLGFGWVRVVFIWVLCRVLFGFDLGFYLGLIWSEFHFGFYVAFGWA